MFYEGDLQNGISAAVQQNKLVACFVTDDGEESSLWENDFLQEQSLRTALSEQTILLRLKAGSVEAGYLAAIFPLPKTPTIVIIKNGELKEYLAAGVSKDDFMKRVGTVLGTQILAQSSSTAALPVSETSASTAQPAASRPAQSSASASPGNQSSAPQGSANDPPQSRAVQDMLSERSARLQAQKEEQDAKEKAKRAEEAKARREAADAAAVPGSKASSDVKYALMQKKRQQEARDERARILKRVEDDKAERREREAARKAEAKAKTEAVAPPTGSSSITPPLANKSAECALQIRLFDGSTIRSRFPSQGTLRMDVRPWIDEKQPGDTPYTFKHVLSPMPNKNIETSEEERSLQSLGLTPSATLILLPVTGYTNAYEGNSGLVSRGVSAGYGLVSSGVGMVTGIFGGFLGAGSAQPASENPQAGSASAPASPNVNVRTLRDQNAGREDQQFYNGNALNFEPRPDEEDKKDD